MEGAKICAVRMSLMVVMVLVLVAGSGNLVAGDHAAYVKCMKDCEARGIEDCEDFCAGTEGKLQAARPFQHVVVDGA
ncbi:hypothetical protein LINGRAHAP2_LOCUS21608 [Linum grandiflorum]